MSTRIEGLEKLFPHILALPIGTYFSANREGTLNIQADGEEVKRVRAAFPGVFWKKVAPDPQMGVGWWEYTTTLGDGTNVRIYADHTGPQSCKRIEETITERVTVPACEERIEERKRTVVRWQCPEEEAELSA